MHVPESAPKDSGIDPRPIIIKKDSLGNTYYFTVQPKMSITVRDTVSDMMDGRE